MIEVAAIGIICGLRRGYIGVVELSSNPVWLALSCLSLGGTICLDATSLAPGQP